MWAPHASQGMRIDVPRSKTRRARMHVNYPGFCSEPDEIIEHPGASWQHLKKRDTHI
jgi:hypothetical protein